MRQTLSYLGLMLPLCLALACEKSDEKTAPDAAALKLPGSPELVMIEHGLWRAGPEWVGWVAQGPKDARVRPELGKGARITDSELGFDLLFLPEKTDLAKIKAHVQKGAEADNSTLTFTTDTPELLEWTAKGENWESQNFHLNMTVGDREITCMNMGGNEWSALTDLHKAACATLAKK